MIHVLAAAVIVGLAGPALAAPPAADPTSAAHYEEGKAALRARAFDQAIARFAQALATARDEPEAWQALLGLALGYELSGDALRGAVHYRRFLSRSASSPLAAGADWGPRRIEATASADRLERALAVTHGLVAIDSEPPGVRVKITPATPHDCVAAPCSLFVAPGAYEVGAYEITAEGTDLVKAVRVRALAGARHDVMLDLRPPGPVGPVGPVGPLGPIEDPPIITAPLEREWPPAATWTLVGGGAAVVTGAIFTALAASDHDDLEALAREPGTDDVLRTYDATRERMEAREAVSWICYAFGGAAIVTGVVLALTAEPAAVDPRPAAAPGALTWRF